MDSDLPSLRDRLKPDFDRVSSDFEDLKRLLNEIDVKISRKSDKPKIKEELKPD